MKGNDSVLAILTIAVLVWMFSSGFITIIIGAVVIWVLFRALKSRDEEKK